MGISRDSLHKSRATGGKKRKYQPSDDFQADVKDPLVDISVTDSTELWLVQWPLNQLQPADFNGKEITLKLNRDGKLGSFESSSGKSYDLVSYAAQAPDAFVIQGSNTKQKVAGKISRRVCLVHYPKPEELEKHAHGNLPLSSQKSQGSNRKSLSRHSGTPLRHGSLLGSTGPSHDTLASVNRGERNAEGSRKLKHKRHEESREPLEASIQSSHASALSRQMTNTSMATESSDKDKSKKKKKVKIEE